MAMKSIMRIKSSNSIHNKTLSKMNNSNSKINASSLAKTQKYFKPRNNPHYPILKKISDDLKKIDADKLMMKANPLLNSTKTIEQIQMYYYGIQKEMNIYKNQEQRKKMLTEKLNKLNYEIDQIVNPKKVISISEIMKEAENYNNNTPDSPDSPNKESKKENKPIIDYGVKIRVLEKELGYTYQGFNVIKAKNNKLISELDELRKQNLYHLNKINELKKILLKSDAKFRKDKTKVEENLADKEEGVFFNQLLGKQKVLSEINKQMTDNIKEINKEITQKKAKEKYLNFTKKKLEKEVELIEQKRIRSLDNFNQSIQKEFDKIKDFTKESEILKNLDKRKLYQLEKILNNIFEETQTENSKQLIDYLSKSCEENLKFKNTVQTLQEKVYKLEEEVSELEYIINFCEEKNSVKKSHKLGERDFKEIKKINNARDLFIKLQYKVINDLYKNYLNQFFELIGQEKEDLNSIKIDKNKLIIEFMHDLYEKLRKYNEQLKKKVINKEEFDFNKWNHKWDKINKVKEGVINNYMKTFGEGIKFDAKSIEDMVEEYLIKEKNNKDKSINIG